MAAHAGEALGRKRLPMTEEKEIFHRHIQRAGLKRTAQRDMILDVFLRTEKHLSSEDLYRLVKEDDPNVGHTTVYRTLKLLVEAGLARGCASATAARATRHLHTRPHDHHICTSAADHRVLLGRLVCHPGAIVSRYISAPHTPYASSACLPVPRKPTCHRQSAADPSPLRLGAYTP